jgi:hypothetical protein
VLRVRRRSLLKVFFLRVAGELSTLSLRRGHVSVVVVVLLLPSTTTQSSHI